MSLAPWSMVDVFNNVEDKLYAFDLLFTEILDRHTPVKTFKARGKLKPCVTDNICGFSKDDKSVADEFNQFFVSVGQSAVDKITSLANECNLTLNESYFTPRQYALSDQFTPSTLDYKQIKRIITLMPSNKAPGIDKIPIHVIKDCLNPIVTQLCLLLTSPF